MPQRTFNLEIVYNADGTDAQAKEAFEIVAHVIRKAAQDVKAKLLVLGGSTKPVVRFTTNDLHEGQIEHMIKLDKDEQASKIAAEGPL